MAYEKHEGIMPTTGDFHLVAPYIRSFLLANGWTEELYTVAVSSTYMAYSRGTVTFKIQATALYFYMWVGTGWDAVAELPLFHMGTSANHFTYNAMEYNPDIYLIDNGKAFYMLGLNSIIPGTLTTYYFACGAGILDTLGVYPDGIFYLGFSYNVSAFNTDTAASLTRVMLGDYGIEGDSPHKYSAVDVGNLEVEYASLYSIVGESSQSNLSTPLFPQMLRAKNAITGSLSPIGSFPGVLITRSRNFHKEQDIIDHQGDQYLLIYEKTDSLNIVSQAIKLT